MSKIAHLDHAGKNDVRASIIASIFAAELGMKAVGLDDNFFDLGGDSLMAENLVLAVQQRFSQKLQTAVLLEAPTPRELAGLIASSSHHPSRQLIVPVAGSEGSEPLAMVHGVSGSSLFANRFGKRLKERYALLAIRAMGIEPGEKPYPTRDEMTRGYFDGIRAATGQVPLIVGGICMGGIIAMEIGRLAYEATGKRPQIVLIDPPPLGSYWMRPKPDNGMTERRRRRLDYHVMYWQVVLAAFEALGLGQTSSGRTARYKVFKKMLFRALAGFIPPRYPCDMLIIASSEWSGDTVDQFREWASKGGRTHTVVMPGTHNKFREANMDAIDSEIIRFLSGQTDTQAAPVEVKRVADGHTKKRAS